MRSVTKAWSFLALSSLTLLVLGHAYGGREGLLTALIAALAANSYVYFFEDKRIQKIFSGRILEGQDSFGLNEIVRRLSLKVRISQPQIMIIPHSAPQCGVIGHGKTSGKIILTQGVFEKFNLQEIEALLAYQIVCIKNTNTLAYAVGSFVLCLCFFVLGLLDGFIRFLIVEKKDINTYVSQPFTRFFSPLLGLLLKLSIHPSFYTQSDLMTSQLVGEPRNLAIVLAKLDSYSKTLPFNISPELAHIFTVNPLAKKSWHKYFIIHPNIKSRVTRLVGYYPL